MKKTLLATALLAAGITQVQADDYNKVFRGVPTKSEVTITFSGFCSGKITDTVSVVWAGASDNPMSSTSYVGSNASMLDMDTENFFHGRSVGTATSIAIKNGSLNIALKNYSTHGLSNNLDRIHSANNDGEVTCKNGQTLNAWLNDISWGTYFITDKTLTNKAYFSLKGSAAPFDFKYAQTVTGYLDLPPVCKNTGVFTDNIAADTFQSSCKMANKVKVKMAITASGKMHYD